MVKQVSPPKGAGASHDRKVKSYLIEAEFYSRHAPLLLADSPDGSGGLAIPVPVHVQASPPRSFTYLLSDLGRDFPVSPGSMDLAELEVALTWLAQLHAR